MNLTVEATYENGTLRLAQPLPLKEREKVQVTVHHHEMMPANSDAAEAMVRQSYGLISWAGDRELLRRLAEDSEFDPQESA